MTASTRAARLALLAGLLVFAIFIAPVMAPSVQLFYRDTGRLYYPVKLYIAQTILSGHLPLWDTMTEAGASILGQLTPGLLHPFTLVYLLLPFDLAFKLNHLLALLFAGVGTYRLSRRIGASEWASLAAAIAYGGSGYLVSMAASNLPYALGAPFPSRSTRCSAFSSAAAPGACSGRRPRSRFRAMRASRSRCCSPA